MTSLVVRGRATVAGSSDGLLSEGPGTLSTVRDDDHGWAEMPEMLPEMPTEIGGLLDRVVRGMGAPGTDAVDLVFNRWADVVGGVLASRTTPVALEHGRLVLRADDPAVVSHVRWLEADLVQRLDELLGAGRVSGVEVRVTPANHRTRRGPPGSRR